MRSQRIVSYLLAILVASSTVLYARATTATETVRMDAAWWNDLSEAAKTTAVQGMLVGFSAGEEFGYSRAHSLVRNDHSPNAAHFEKLLYAHYQSGRATFSKTFGTYVHEVSDLYANNPSIADHAVREFFGCFADRPQVSCDDVIGLMKSVPAR